MTTKVNFDDLTFEEFRKLAALDHLSPNEKVGFPNEYREGKEQTIFNDVRSKLQGLEEINKTVLEIGPGCSQLPVLLAQLCDQNKHQVHFVDSSEMLAHLPNESHIKKWSGRYPDTPKMLEQLTGRVDIIIAYSVIQYVFVEDNLWKFLDVSLSLLADGGEILLGDIPNITMRKRFFSSAAGIKSHREYTQQDLLPDVKFNQIELGKMDDSVVFSILTRARSQGYHAWVIPQGRNLPMSNRREDILIRKP